MAKAVYIHIPFCKSICSYCDFCKMFYVKKWAKNYFETMTDEIKEIYEGDEISSIYIGGGTPSILNKDELLKLDNIIKIFNKTPNCEITFECNLNDLNDIYLNYLKNLNINRLSIGIESFNENKLKLMGRDATFDYAQKIIKIARTKGFNNINVDFMYAMPNETLKEFKDDLKKIIKLKPDHISAYSLILEPHTKLHLRYNKSVDEDTEYQMYKYLNKTLISNGYNQYELSNYSKPNYESVHNKIYWKNSEYYGFGLGACGYLEGVRYENTRNINKYLDGKYIKSRDLLSKEDEIKNGIMLGLRLTKGIDLIEWKNRYNFDLLDYPNVKELIKQKLLINDINYLYINPKKLYIMNEILLKLI